MGTADGTSRRQCDRSDRVAFGSEAVCGGRGQQRPVEPSEWHLLEHGCGRDLAAGRKQPTPTASLLEGGASARLDSTKASSSTPAALYAAVDAMPLGGVQRFRSYDGGATWTALAPTPGGAETRAWHLLLAADPDNPNHVFVNDGYSLYESTDGGSSWSHADDGVGWIVANHGFDWVNLSFDASGDAIATADQGVLREHKPSTGKWTSLIGDLQVSEFYTITLDPNDTSVAYAVGQDLYSSKFTGGLAWDMLEDAVGEAGNFVVDPTNTQVVYGYNPLDPASFVRRSNDHGQSWTVICTPADVGGSDYGLAYDTQKAFVMDPSNHDRLLIGTTKILETKNASAASPTWNAISNVLTGDAQHVTARGRTFRREHDLCRDARRARLVHLRRRIALVPTGQRPERCRGAGVIGDLSIDPADAGHVYAVASGDVWELSTPAGTPIWTRLTGAVPTFETGAALYVDWHAPDPCSTSALTAASTPPSTVAPPGADSARAFRRAPSRRSRA